MKSLNLINDYLSNRKQWVKEGGTYSSWWEILYGVPQGSILAPLLFKTFLCNLLYFIKSTDTTTYANDTIPYNANLTQQLVINEFAKTSILFKRFKNNFVKVNSDKSYLLTSGNKAIANIDNNRIKSEKIHELLGIAVDSKLIYETILITFAKKQAEKEAWISNYITFDKREIIMKAFIISQFSYCPFVWIIHSKRLGKKINTSHERI